MTEYSDEEKFAASVQGLEPEEMYQRAILFNFMQIGQFCEQLAEQITLKSDWPDEIKDRATHIMQFFVVDCANLIRDVEVSQDGNSGKDGD